jgi:hypothetical protein
MTCFISISPRKPQNAVAHLAPAADGGRRWTKLSALDLTSLFGGTLRVPSNFDATGDWLPEDWIRQV